MGKQPYDIGILQVNKAASKTNRPVNPPFPSPNPALTLALVRHLNHGLRARRCRLP